LREPSSGRCMGIAVIARNRRNRANPTIGNRRRFAIKNPELPITRDSAI
jgi:hypothetical protein